MVNNNTLHALGALFVGGVAGALQQSLNDGISLDQASLQKLAVNMVVGGILAVLAYFAPSPAQQKK
jgi:hypothetical protein